MGRLFRLVILVGLAFVFGIFAERELAARRCENGGGAALMGLCMMNPELGVGQ